MPQARKKRIERYEQRINELKRLKKEAEAEEKKQERKTHTTKLIAYGLLVLHELKTGKRTEADLKRDLNGILTQKSHRKAVGLSETPDAAKTQAAKKSPPANVKTTKSRTEKRDSVPTPNSSSDPLLPVTSDDAIAAEFES